MGFLDILHRILDYFLGLCRLVQNREVGWKTVNRKTGREMREQQPLMKKLKIIVLFNPLTEWIDNTHMMRLWLHKENVSQGGKEATPRSKKQIKPFVDFYRINMNDFEPSDINAYNNFEDFFVRHHTKASRPIFAPDDPTIAVVVADSRLVVYPTVTELHAIWVKGKHFTMANLLADNELAAKFADGAVASFRLSPQDYHRYHSPVSGTVVGWKRIDGDYYQVDPIALRSDVDILTRNARCWVWIRTEEFGDVVFVAIGATDVGTVEINPKWQKPGHQIRKGDEVGIFQFGGSSIVVAFEKGRIQFDEDLLSVSKHAIAMDVEVGMSMGRATRLG